MRAAERPEKANFEFAAASGTAQPPQIMAAQPPAADASAAVAVAKDDAAAAIVVAKERVACVQCDRCGKWRGLGDVDALPDEWFCELNADGRYSSCEVAMHDV